MPLHWDRNEMGDAAKTSPHIPSICTPNAILSSVIKHIIPSRQIYVAIDNPSIFHLSPLLLLVAISGILYVQPIDVSQAEKLQCNSYFCISHRYKFRDRINVTLVVG
jgi:hypothetical protein